MLGCTISLKLNLFHFQSHKMISSFFIEASHNQFIIGSLMESIGFKLIKLILTYTIQYFTLIQLDCP